ncbi:Peptidase M16 inactive domain protein [Posidoniimonas corsicana]|uniref:Peptidase M16 inactive domain protein n=2 Tax=Posidoniimonas corsicana TaxID=1938618 RepID=A0A5C5VC43_9BACT|nr:Peptidase M16 inactive domain protein [Posidoniimonas corsicana]
MVLLGEPNPSFQSAAFTMLAPAGCRHDPAGKAGLASLTCEMTLRGAGDRDGRALINDLDALGVDRGESVGVSQVSLRASGMAEALAPALEIYADILRRPLLPADQIEAGRMVCLQELRGIEDEPSHKLMQELRRQHYPSPWGLPSQGEIDTVKRLTPHDVEAFHGRHYQPGGAILAIAGGFEWERIVDLVQRLFADWEAPDEGAQAPPPEIAPVTHIPYESNQCHIGLAYDSVPYDHDDYFQAWASVGVLSGGMSSRLFTEVREKRGLCYTVSASLQSQKERSAVFCYAGTTCERAQETLDVTHAELLKLRDGIKQNELDCLKARIKSSLILQQESSSSRSGSLAHDWYRLGRVRPVDELSAIIDAITAESINKFLEGQPPENFTLVTLGPEPLESPVGIS